MPNPTESSRFHILKDTLVNTVQSEIRKHRFLTAALFSSTLLIPSQSEAQEGRSELEDCNDFDGRIELENISVPFNTRTAASTESQVVFGPGFFNHITVTGVVEGSDPFNNGNTRWYEVLIKDPQTNNDRLVYLHSDGLAQINDREDFEQQVICLVQQQEEDDLEDPPLLENDLDDEPIETIKLPSRVYYEGIGYRAPVEGVTSTGNTEVGRFSHHITGRFNSAEKITMPLVNPFTGEEVEVSMIRYVVDVQIDEDRQIHIAVNSFDYDGNMVFSLSRDGAAETIPIMWDQFSTIAQEGQEVVLLLRNLMPNQEWLDSFEESLGSCTEICEQALAFNEARLEQAPILQNLVNQNYQGLENGDTVEITELAGGVITRHSVSP